MLAQDRVENLVGNINTTTKPVAQERLEKPDRNIVNSAKPVEQNRKANPDRHVNTTTKHVAHVVRLRGMLNHALKSCGALYAEGQ